MIELDPAIENYVLSKMTRPSALCEELAEYTRTHVPMSIMLCGPSVAGFLGFLCRLLRAKHVLEIGCYTGYSALAMAEQMPEGGRVTTLDINPKNGEIARSFWQRSPHPRTIELIVAPALETLESLEGPWELVFIDADKVNYLNYLQGVLPKLAPQAVIVADNCLYSGQVLNLESAEPNAHAIHAFNEWVHHNPKLHSYFLPIRDGLQVITPI